MLHQSLCETGDSSIANGLLKDFIRQLNTFGLGLMRLDIRQEAERHANAMDEIIRHLDLPNYKEWDEDKKVEFLVKELQNKRPLLPRSMTFSDEVVEVLNTFKTIAELPRS